MESRQRQRATIAADPPAVPWASLTAIVALGAVLICWHFGLAFRVLSSDFDFHQRVAEGDTKAVERLIELGADVNSVDRSGNTPLMVACSFGNSPVVKLLLSKGADPRRENRTGATALHAAAGGLITSDECVRQLLHAGVDVDAKSSMGQSPLMLAALHDRLGAVALLIDKGADFTARDSRGRNALWYAAGGGEGQSVRLLVALGLSVSDVDMAGNTPLHDAVAAESERSVAVLLAAGADAERANLDGLTPLNMATRSGNLVMIRSLTGHKVPDFHRWAEPTSSPTWTSIAE
ncbi:ankyrin repeat domain-containing protein [Humisphaera borealis]|uniref:Ankyrin repeat domain-containing protein n=1 Tax=Humisphaera borealis TaxID=2807512 RepID=A0A7M2X219_9BACT|nr:ankyrin repeat domain-containing protein [Humisphaera borealis]QOV90790.1 ankyrin repeat domain-containing protein [Humisphaera borealis]